MSETATDLLRELFYLRMPMGMKLEEVLVECGHQHLWQRVFALIEPKHAPPSGCDGNHLHPDIYRQRVIDLTRERDRFCEILMTVCALLEIPRCEDGPCETAARYEDAINRFFNDDHVKLIAEQRDAARAEVEALRAELHATKLSVATWHTDAEEQAAEVAQWKERAEKAEESASLFKTEQRISEARTEVATANGHLRNVCEILANRLGHEPAITLALNEAHAFLYPDRAAVRESLVISK